MSLETVDVTVEINPLYYYNFRALLCISESNNFVTLGITHHQSNTMSSAAGAIDCAQQ